MDRQSGQDAGLALRALARVGLHEGVPAYIALLTAIIAFFLLAALL